MSMGLCGNFPPQYSASVTFGEMGKRKRGKWRERGKNNAKRRREKKSTFINAVRNNEGCIYSITKGIVYCIQRQRVECIINKMSMHNEYGAVRQFSPSILSFSYFWNRSI